MLSGDIVLALGREAQDKAGLPSQTRFFQITHRYSQPLSNPASHESQYYTSNRNSEPESSLSHSTCEIGTMPYTQHECDDPPTNSDLDANIAAQEEST